MIPVIKATILNCIRDRKNLIFMIFFPIFLVFLIGNIFTSYFSESNSNSAIDKVNIYYFNEGNDEINEVLNDFISTVKNSKEIKVVNVKEVNTLEEGKQKVRVNRDIFLHLRNNTIDFYSNDKSYIESSLIQGILVSITNRYNAVSEVFKINPIKGEEIVKSRENINFIKEDIISRESSPSSMDYYGVAEIGLMMFYFIGYPLWAIKEYKRNNIKDRIKLSGVSVNKYYLSIFIGCFIFSFFVALITYILSNILFDINYGNNLFIMPLAMIPFLILINGIGIILAIIFKKDKITSTIVQSVVIPVLTFLGGGYVAIYGEMDGIFNLLTKLSPLRWFNSSIFRYIYSGDESMLYNWIIFGFIVLVAVVILVYILARREEAGNEKYFSSN